MNCLWTLSKGCIVRKCYQSVIKHHYGPTLTYSLTIMNISKKEPAEISSTVVSLESTVRTAGLSSPLLCPPDPGLWRHEPRVGGQRVAAQPGSAPVPLLLHGIAGGCPYAWSPHQERTEGPAEDGGQFPQVWKPDTYTHYPSTSSLVYKTRAMCPSLVQGESSLWNHVLEALELWQEGAGEEEGWKSAAEPRWGLCF